MNALIVEDQDEKRQHLSAFLHEVIPGLRLDTARSLQSGLQAVLGRPYDLVLLDMTMPTFDTGPDEPGGRPQSFAGREILEQMERRDRQTPTVIVTQYDTFGEDQSRKTLGELDAELQRNHPSWYLGAVYYNAAVSGWKEALIKKVQHLPGITIEGDRE